MAQHCTKWQSRHLFKNMLNMVAILVVILDSNIDKYLYLSALNIMSGLVECFNCTKHNGICLIWHMLCAVAILDAMLDFDLYRTSKSGTPTFPEYVLRISLACKILYFNRSGNDFSNKKSGLKYFKAKIIQQMVTLISPYILKQ